MKCISIITEGNLFKGREQFYKNGFLVIPYQSRIENAAEPNASHSPLHTLAQALEDPAFRQETYALYTNGIPTGQYRVENLMEELNLPSPQHKHTLILSDAPSSDQRPPLHQTFAILVHSSQRNSLASILRQTPQITPDPVQFLKQLIRSGQLHADILNIPAFAKAPPLGTPKSQHPETTFKLAVLLPSYKRFEDCLRQIHSMLSQTYQADIYVGIKGLSKYDVETIIKPIFSAPIESGRLHIDYYPNSNQLTNIVDCIRNHPYQKYHLLVKIDDDDFYGPRYLESIVNVHRQIPHGCSSFYSGKCLYLKKSQNTPYFQKGFMSIFGRTLVITPQLFQTILNIENSPADIGLYCDEVRTLHKNSTSFCFTEDNLMRMLMCENGAVNRADFIDNEDVSHGIIAHGSNHSVLRGNLVDEDFYQGQRNLSSRCLEQFVHLIHPSWTDTIRIFKDKAVRVSSGNSSQAQVLSFDQKQLTLKWDQYGTEQFIARQNGAYVLN